MNDRDLIDNIRKLWLLQIMVECGSFREAATRAKVTQSALSQTLSQLEALTGRVLVRRERGHLEVTEHGRELLVRVQPVLSAVQKVATNANAAPEIAWISLGAYESFASRHIPELMVRLNVKIPGIRLTLRVARSGALASLVRKGDLCMAVVRELDEMGRLDAVQVASDRLAFWAAPTHPVVAQGWGLLGEHELGALAPDVDGHPRYHVRLLDEAGLRRPPAFVSDNFESLKAAALRGAVVATLPESLAVGSGLAEIRAPEGAPALGVHKILMISKPGCDPQENAFLEAELKGLLKDSAAGACSVPC